MIAGKFPILQYSATMHIYIHAVRNSKETLKTFYKT